MQSEASPSTGILILIKYETRKLNMVYGILNLVGSTWAISQNTILYRSEGIHFGCWPSDVEGQKMESYISQWLQQRYPELKGPLPTMEMWQNFMKYTKRTERRRKIFCNSLNQKQSDMAMPKKTGVYGRAPQMTQLMMETRMMISQKYFLCSASRTKMHSSEKRKRMRIYMGKKCFFIVIVWQLYFLMIICTLRGGQTDKEYDQNLFILKSKVNQFDI